MNRVQNQWMKKMITGLIMLLFLSVTVSAVLSYFIFTNDLKERLIGTNMELLEHMEQKLELVLKNVDNEAIQLVQYDEVKKFFDDNLPQGERTSNDYRVGSHIDRLIRSDDYLFSVDLYSYSQDRLVSGDILTEELRLRDYAWISHFAQYDGYSDWLASRKVLISNSSFPIYRNVVTLVRTYPLIHSSGARKGAVAVNLKEEMLLPLIHHEEDAQGLNLVLDKEGRVVIHQDQSQLGENLGSIPFVAQIAAEGKNAGTFKTKLNNRVSTVFYKVNPYTGWRIVRIVSDIEMNKPLLVIRNTLAVLSGVILLLAVVLALAVGRWTFKPLNRFLGNLALRLNAQFPQELSGGGEASLRLMESRFEDILENSEQLRKQVRETKPILKWQLIMELLSNYKINIANTRQYMDMLGMQLDMNRFVVLAAEFDQRHELTPRDVHLYNYALCNIAEELIHAEGKGMAIELENGCCAILMSFSDGDGEAELRAGVVAELIKNYVMENFNRTVTIGVGGLAGSAEEIHLSFRQACDVLAYRLILGGNTVITRDDVQIGESALLYRLIAMTDGMMDSLKLLDGEKLIAQMDRWFDAFTQYGIPPEMIRQINLQCLMKAVLVAGEAGVEPAQLRMPQEMRTSLHQYESLEDMKRFMLETLRECMEAIRQKRSSREKNDLIEKVLAYIHGNYGRAELSLNLLADEFRVSLSHLSKLFKEQTESNFIDYLMNLRISQAKKLLTETEGRIRDIAEAVGYSNVNSFVRIFKKLTALTPTEYREHGKKDSV
ncbi:helix-turn-helix domain-containing protein [Paenibacillus whitsoniae]|uniref:Helix-turn-helix domain-containing protein n=2 Tax=Paenibacillus whitsoniae TaxID=2496558 RepID=A0A430J799_9BACL|nr:helix-turn-helix domain-containing protein [Paenibacillus whitsoniae]